MKTMHHFRQSLIYILHISIAIVVISVLALIPVGLPRVQSASIIIAATDSNSYWKSIATVICDGTSDESDINTYLTSGNSVQLAVGTFTVDGNIILSAGNRLYGQGVTTIIHLDGTSAIINNSTSNIEIDDFKITGDEWESGGIFISCYNNNVSNVYVHDITNEALGGSDFVVYANRGTITNVRFEKCVATAPDGFGFLINGEGIPSSVTDVFFYECDVTDAGVAATRISEWITGFDFAEYSAMTVSRIYVLGCTVDGAWESDFHFEADPIKTDCVIINSDADNAGEKGISSTYGAGFLVDGRADIILEDNTASTNEKADIRAYNGATYDDYSIADKVFPSTSSKSVTTVSQGNCDGAIITNGKYKDLILYSTNGLSVSQYISLGGSFKSNDGNTYTFSGTTVLASFTNYAIMHLVSTSVISSAIIGFVSTYDIANYGSLDNINFPHLTHLVYTDIRVTSSTDATLQDINDADFSYLDNTVSTGHSYNLSVLFSLYGDSVLTALISNNTYRANLISNISNFITAHNLDGVDIDIEDLGSYGTPTNTLLNELRLAIPDAIITIDVTWYPPGDINFNMSIAASSNVDYINVMTYDMNTPHALPEHSRYDDSIVAMAGWASAGYPKSKLLMGIPFYGKDNNGSVASYAQIYDQFNPSDNQDSVTTNTVNGFGGSQDVHGGVLWWSGIDTTISKINWLKTNGYGGSFVFTAGYDKFGTGSLLTAIYNTVTAGSGGENTGVLPNPNSISLIATKIKVFQNLFQTGDMAFFVTYNLSYSTIPTVDIGDAYSLALLSPVGALKATRPLLWYGYAGQALYFNASQVATMGLVWGESSSIRIMPNPAYLAPVENTNQATKTLGSNNWISSASKEINNAEGSPFSTFIILMMQGIETGQAKTTGYYVGISDGGDVLTQNGRSFMLKVLPTLDKIVPHLFITSISDMSVDFATTNTETNLQTSIDAQKILGDSFEQEKTNISAWMGISRNSAGGIVAFFILALMFGIAFYVIRDTTSAMLITFALAIVLAGVGLFPINLFFTLIIVAATYMLFLIWRVIF